ncbi:MAG: cysteine--tRNA ligase [Negativicutes bacterium]
MKLRVYNTLTKHKDDFVPIVDGNIRMYVCGVTPYNHPHIGNARPPVVWDVIRRYLEHRGMNVFYVSNFTDVDDKIINTALAEKVDWKTVADRYIAAYYVVMDKLNVRRADNYPRVSEHMPEIIGMVETLVAKGFAYVVDGDVYFAVEKFAGYGKLSGRNLEDMQAGARVDIDERKNHPMDFALWKTAKPGEPYWESPWGKGRPGWHIECSAMSIKYLGDTFDFHGGGSDLIFPHHENEIAQTEAFTGKPFVNYWLHNGFITIDQEKMSKSLGNFSLVSDILQHYSGEVLRLFIANTHYRSPLDFSDERLIEAKKNLEKIVNARESLLSLAKIAVTTDADSAAIERIALLRAEFYEAMDDDFNTALAFSVMYALIKEINICMQQHSLGIAIPVNHLDVMTQLFEDITVIFGILEQKKETSGSNDVLVEKLLDLVIALRQEARVKKDWAASDAIRDRLAEIGVVLEDGKDGVKWKLQ